MSESNSSPDDLKMLDMTSICELLGIGRRTLQTWRQSGRFPAPDLDIGKTVRWRQSTIHDWLASQAAAQDGA